MTAPANIEPIQLIIGLGNPGTEYAATRHNAGAWFVETLAQQTGTTLRPEKKFQGLYAKTMVDGHPCHLLVPSTFMNLSGQAVHAVMKFYKIPVSAILVAHDELDLDPGTAKLKFDGGHAGHNGLRNIIEHAKTRAYLRLRIGIGRLKSDRGNTDYVLGRPSNADKQAIDGAIQDGIYSLDALVNADLQKAMRELHQKDL